MFGVDCPVLATRVEIEPAHIRGWTGVGYAVELAFDCRCGGSGAWRSGVSARAELVRHEGPDARNSARPRTARDALDEDATPRLLDLDVLSSSTQPSWRRVGAILLVGAGAALAAPQR